MQWPHLQQKDVAVVCHGSGLLWQWSVMAVVCHGSGLLWQWSVMAVVCLSWQWSVCHGSGLSVMAVVCPDSIHVVITLISVSLRVCVT